MLRKRPGEPRCGGRDKAAHAATARPASRSSPGLPRLGLVEALETVVGDGLPGRGICGERAPAQAHAGIVVEGRHAHAHLEGVAGIAAEQVRAALAAEALLETAFGMAPCLQELLAGHETESRPVDSRLRRGGRAGALLTARAVAVAAFAGGLGQLEAHAAAQTAAAHRGLAHARQSRIIGATARPLAAASSSL